MTSRMDDHFTKMLSAPDTTSSNFKPASNFQGKRPGFVFKLGDLGLGYYYDPVQGVAQEISVSNVNKILD